ncbi:DJ-1/PfpI family protein [Streptoalloteichus hindustanus]|uniref:Tat (Twin-arginine translocation) pathway signal sequence n=1 Tax=Streptoalloteichus hindustanus TaxID=2017 RepID=A0A1M5EMC2_STRHI|nr:DJ-1/PfpI family protein [Streptoalloteichus hindustanus]SHF80438.1 Tat (twin-arginine translocation) pathway signal sequence [Streptoalloteichus hindustanus]
MGSSRRDVLRAAAVGGVGLGLTALGAPAHAEGAEPPRQDQRGKGPRIGILLYEGFSVLDPTGPAEVLSRLPGATVTMIAERPGLVRTDTGDIALLAERSIAQVRDLDVLLVPGGSEKAVLRVFENPRLLDWIRRVHQRTRWTTSVCTGSMILGKAGLLNGLRATTYWAGKDYLETLGATFVKARYVRDGKIITSAGVSAGQDMALYLASLLTDDRTAQAVQLGIEYDPHPPFDTGSPDKADPELRALALKLLADSQV